MDGGEGDYVFGLELFAVADCVLVCLLVALFG